MLPCVPFPTLPLLIGFRGASFADADKIPPSSQLKTSAATQKTVNHMMRRSNEKDGDVTSLLTSCRPRIDDVKFCTASRLQKMHMPELPVTTGRSKSLAAQAGHVRQ